MRSNPITSAVILIGIGMLSCTLSSIPTTAPTSVIATLSTTPTTPPTVTATATFIPTPEGAGFITPPVTVHFDTNLENLSAGEYLIVQVMDDVQNNNTVSKFRYISLDGRDSGFLFSVNGQIERGFMNSGTNLNLVWKTGDNTGILFIDLKTQEVQQFGTGCNIPTVPMTLSPYGAHYIAFQCQREGLTWYIVSREDGIIHTYQFPESFRNTNLDWISPNLAQITNNMTRVPPPNEEAFCLIKPPMTQLRCFVSVPEWWVPDSNVSPDGTRFFSHGKILPIDCIEDPEQEICVGDYIGYPSEDLKLYSLFQDVSWSPDGSKLLFTKADRDPWETVFWIYDIAANNGVILYSSPDVVYPGPWTYDGQHFLVIEKNNAADRKIWLISSVTGQMTRVASNVSGIWNVVGLFQVP